MEIVDIPDQIAKRLKYSVRSWSSFFLSLAGAVVILGISYDLLYSFFYTRIHNVKDAYYGHRFWWSLVLVAVVVPIVFAVGQMVSNAFQTRRFGGTKFGVAIAPFEVISLDTETLGTASKLQALDEIMNQFFVASQRLLKDEAWTKDFEFRILPPYAHVRTKADAQSWATSVGATLLIWGAVVQQSKSLKTILHLLGTELDLTLTGPLDPFSPALSLKLWSLVAAAYKLSEGHDYNRAEKFFILAKEPAEQLDALSQDKRKALTTGLEKSINDLHAAQHPQPAGIVAS